MNVESPKTIESLSEYITLLQEYPSSESIFRGENEKFDKRKASAFRNSGHFMQPINEYYSAIGHRLSDIEKQNFLAFAQHHGLPTNLLDVTSNPLNALFFACHEAKEKGYVYIFSNRFLIDVTDIIEEHRRESVFDLFIAGNPTVINKIHSLIRELFESMRTLLQFTGEAFIMPGNSFINQSFCELFCIARDMYFEKNKVTIDNVSYEELLVNVQGDGIVRANEVFFHDFYKAVDVERDRFQKLFDAICEDEIMNDVNISKKPMEDLMFYIVFALYCFRVKHNYRGSISSNDCGKLLPMMIYRPKITFERARLQQGYFLYMPYRAALGAYADIEVELNNVSHTQIVEVKNPAQVLCELENIGINIGTIYGDYDNIAKHIKAKTFQQVIGGNENG